MTARRDDAFPPCARAVGFSLAELSLVVTISTMVVLGLAAVIEVPRMVVENYSEGGIDRADRTLSALDRDLRYAVDVTLNSPTSITVTSPGGEVTTYSWGGASGDPLLRESGGDTVEVLDRVVSVAFDVDMSSAPVNPTNTDATESIAVAASFEAFSLLNGFFFAAIPPLIPLGIGVNVSVAAAPVSKSNQVGIGFTADVDGDGSPATLRCRLRRNGSNDLNIRVYRAAALDQPNYLSGWVASAFVRNADLPTSFAEVEIPLTVFGAIRDGEDYFIRLWSAGTSSCADMEYQVLSLANASAVLGSAFVMSSNYGLGFASITGLLASSQTQFSIEVTHTDVDPPSPPVDTEAVVTAVQLRLVLHTKHGSQVLRVSFPLLNNIAKAAG